MKIEGKNAVYENLAAGKAVYKIYLSKAANQAQYKDILDLARKANVKVELLERQELDKISLTKNNQGVLAEMQDFVYSSVEDILAVAGVRNEPAFVVALDGVEDPHNLGSIIRVCDCSGVHGIIIPKHNACPVNETVAKVSAGAISHVKIAKVTNLNQALEELKQKGVWVYAAELGGASIYEQNLTGAICLVVGGEGKGVSQLTKKVCDGVVTLPMRGGVNSLNASVACGITVYEALRQRGAK
ncbi:MAG: 23S rRNA (guanosine(2251)-2'-O)-methyltransferase RlmB [Firmicutes bacterium]|nr:23S rRNA (guanosine(2251)-2'-O)-methyltransferase RlmB [Bacillota bacterium]